MGNQVTLAYKIRPTGLTSAQLVTLMGAAVLPTDILNFLAVRVTSDVTAFAAPDVVRTIVLNFNPPVPPAGHAVLVPGDVSGAPITTNGLVLDAPGLGLLRPPRIAFSPVLNGRSAIGKAFLSVGGVTGLIGGSGYTAPTVKFVGGLSSLFVQTIDEDFDVQPPTKNVAEGVHILGVAATAHATVALGVITAIIVDTPGSLYEEVPQIVIQDPTGTGASATANMQVDQLALIDPGKGYTAPPTITLVPWFKTMFPDTSNQAVPFVDLFTGLLSRATLSPVTASPPVVA